jgi:hypothetical protein
MRWFEKIAASRYPDFVIGKNYCRRWWIIPRNRFFNIYLHHFLHSDDDRALHDHPWANASYLLAGQYIEVEILAGGVERRTLMRAGDWRFRLPTSAHRIELIGNQVAWSLFITGPVVRDWGFHCPKGWRLWKDFVDERDHGSIGRGCD